LVDTGVAHRVAVVGDTVQEAECSRNRRIEL